MIDLTFKMELTLKGIKTSFNKELGPGVLVEQCVTFKNVKDPKDPMLIKAIMDRRQEFIDENIEVKITHDKTQDNNRDTEKSGTLEG